MFGDPFDFVGNGGGDPFGRTLNFMLFNEVMDNKKVADDKFDDEQKNNSEDDLEEDEAVLIFHFP